ncbi:MAG: universal stress protein [Flavobacteriales bacterium]
MKTILVATDYSPAASNAVEYAAQLARSLGSTLILFHSYKMSIHASNSLVTSKGSSKLYQRSEKQLADLAAKTSKRHGISVKHALREGDPVDAIKSYMKYNVAEMVVMGIESNLKEYKLFGNTTTAVIKLMQFPLLVVPNDIHYDGVQKVMYACETSYLKDNCELGVMKRFVNELKAHLEVFHVVTKDEDERSLDDMERVMARILHDVDHEFKYVNNAKVGDGIREGLERFPADLLIMIPHRVGFFEGLTKGSQTSSMTVKTRVPLLVIPNEKAC